MMSVSIHSTRKVEAEVKTSSRDSSHSWLDLRFDDQEITIFACPALNETALRLIAQAINQTQHPEVDYDLIRQMP